MSCDSYLLGSLSLTALVVSRLASVAADRQKGDFIGSISHEFRSPLHGILASAEFLSDTEADAFQSRLVDTILSCGRTLLDTINHILVFSKINAFERSWQNARKPGVRPKELESKLSMNKDELPLTNIYEIIDVAALTEEVIEGVYAGQVYQDISSSDFTDVSSKSHLKTLRVRSNSGVELPSGEHGAELSLIKEIEVVLEFAHENFTFSTQPGALRRVSYAAFRLYATFSIHLLPRLVCQLTLIYKDRHEHFRQRLKGDSPASGSF